MKDNIKVVPDTSVVIDARLSNLVEEGKLVNPHIILSEFVLEEIRAQASRGKEIGFEGLDEIRKWRELEEEGKVTFEKQGRRQTTEEIKLAKYGRVDALIADMAKENNAVLCTSDLVQAKVAEAEGVEVQYFEPYEEERKMSVDDLLTDDTMSLHLKEGCRPQAKRGHPGEFKLEYIQDEILTKEDMEAIIREINDAARYENDSFVEFDHHEASVIQLGRKRIAIARPPFSDGLEVTVVRPIVSATLDDYELADELRDRFAEQAEGILIAGPPGSGKSTFAAALAEFYHGTGKIVKTFESPKDLQVSNEITQYGALKGDFVKSSDILLLVRPDYTVYDEVRKTKDFRVFSDMRLAGVGMIGVTHATKPIDAIQRFIGRVEMGMIPHVIDTIAYIKEGRVDTVYKLQLVVRTPHGMTEDDLARPLIEVTNFGTGKCEYEIYSYGEENVIVPIGEQEKKKSAMRTHAEDNLKHVLKKYDKDVEVEFVSDNKAVVRVDNEVIPRLIGKKGKVISKIEDDLGVRIDVQPKTATTGKNINLDVGETGAYIVLNTGKEYKGKNIDVFVDDELLFSATVGRSGEIRVSKDSEIGESLLNAVVNKKNLKAFFSN